MAPHLRLAESCGISCRKAGHAALRGAEAGPGRRYRNALCRGGGRPGARQRNDGLEAGVFILELELAAMEAGHRRGEAQPQPRAGLRTALFEPNEALDRTA